MPFIKHPGQPDLPARLRDAWLRYQRAQRLRDRAAEEFDAALREARQASIGYPAIAALLVEPTGEPSTTARRRRAMAKALRERQRRATRRGRNLGRASRSALPVESVVGTLGENNPENTNMPRRLIKRTTEEWYSTDSNTEPLPADHDLEGDDLEGDDFDDAVDDDDDDLAGAGPAPLPGGRR